MGPSTRSRLLQTSLILITKLTNIFQYLKARGTEITRFTNQFCQKKNQLLWYRKSLISNLLKLPRSFECSIHHCLSLLHAVRMIQSHLPADDKSALQDSIKTWQWLDKFHNGRHKPGEYEVGSQATLQTAIDSTSHL